MPNQLVTQTSPYLLQHANNPVNWYPWSAESLELARSSDKPILLSIGYSACHWCHVMERESFENADIAEIMNSLFVCIKVDREERPDLDKVYQLAHQMLTQRPGGWPLTVALTPDGHAPFFAGTYFPPEARFNIPGFGDLLKKVEQHFRTNRSQLVDYHNSFRDALEKLNPAPGQASLPNPISALLASEKVLAQQYDSEFGGFGDAPKFPHPTQIELLLLFDHLSPDPGQRAADMVKNTLSHMGRSGLFDHLGGGFFRYSVDRKWQIPHFEKMLYDNAQLISLYSSASQKYPDLGFAEIAKSTGRWVIDEMQQTDGGYASTLDADSEDEEGKFYVWNETDLRAILKENEYTHIENYFGLFGEPNFDGSWHFNINPETNFELLQKSPETLACIDTAISSLYKVRSERIMPALDDKILTSWNGLMIAGMARSSRILTEPALLHSAHRAIDFVRKNMWQGGRLLAVCSQGKAHLNGYLDDYAFMLCGLLESMQCRWRSEDLEFSVQICNAMLDKFEDSDSGGLYYTSHDHEKLLYRGKHGADDAIPSGNGIAIRALLLLGNLLGDTRYLKSAARALDLYAGDLQKHPSVHAATTIALQSAGDNHQSVILRGNELELEQWRESLQRQYRPLASVFMIPDDADNLPGALKDKKPGKNICGYLCTGTRCLPPFENLEKLKEALT